MPWTRNVTKYGKKTYFGTSMATMFQDVPVYRVPKTWACNCREEALLIAEYGRATRHSRFERTEVDADGVCIACGYYAIWMAERELDGKKQRRAVGKYKVKK